MTKKKSTAEASAPATTARHPLATGVQGMDRLFEHFLREPWGSGWSAFAAPGLSPFSRAQWPLTPSAELTETDEAFALNVELPGLDEKDIDLTVADGQLTLKGEKREEKTSAEGESHFSERRYGSFRRSFTLPPGVAPEAVKASFAKGVLTVRMPKSQEAKASARRVAVETG